MEIVASLNTPRHNVGTVVVEDHICAIGGFGSGSLLNSIECYDAKTDKWNCFVDQLSVPHLRIIRENSDIDFFLEE